VQVHCRNGFVAGIKNLTGTEFVELVFAQLEQTDIRPGALLGVETGLDPEIQTESVGSALGLLDQRSDRGVLE
jgi:translation initiation factor 2 gamma subunit (eIF-2gamma)